MIIHLPINNDFSESIQYNNAEIPAYIRKGVLSVYPNYSAVSHWHDELEFIVILEGSMIYDVNGEYVTLKKGQGIFVNSQNFHYGFSKTKEECIFAVILLHPSLLSQNPYITSEYLQPLLRNQNMPYQKLSPVIDWQNQILLSLTDLYYIYQKREDPFAVISYFAKIMGILFAHSTTEEKDSSADRDFQSLLCMVEYIKQHYTENLNLNDIAVSGSCCKTKCSDLFKQYLHVSPGKYVIDYRLEKSIDLLLQGEHSVTEIAYDIGFSSPSHYCDTFRKHYGLTPKEYQKS
mgnify:CR=1 FL=1